MRTEREILARLREARERLDADRWENRTDDQTPLAPPVVRRLEREVEILEWTLENVRREPALAPVHERVRPHDPSTSWEAALSVSPESTAVLYAAIYRALSLRPMTDYELRADLAADAVPHSHSGASARRVELERAGWIRKTGEKRDTPNGRPAHVFEAVPEETDER